MGRSAAGGYRDVRNMLTLGKNGGGHGGQVDLGGRKGELSYRVQATTIGLTPFSLAEIILIGDAVHPLPPSSFQVRQWRLEPPPKQLQTDRLRLLAGRKSSYRGRGLTCDLPRSLG